MDSSAYKTFKNTRALTYHYYFSAPKHNLPFIVFVHGFPSTSYDWHHQATFFKEKGFGLIIPDMLGYGGSSTTPDYKLYMQSLLAKDIIDILDVEKIQQVIIVGHDWGSGITSRVIQLYADRIIAAGFLAVGYVPPSPEYDHEKFLAFAKEKLGSELFGYWEFFAEEGADKIIVDNWEAYCAVIWPEDPKTWITHMAPRNALKSHLLSGEVLKQASWLSEEDRKYKSETLLKGGLSGPLCYYKMMLSNDMKEEAKTIPKENYQVTKPVFFGAAVEDYCCLADLYKDFVSKFCVGKLTIKEFMTNHWVMDQAKDEVNRELLAWIEELSV